MATFANARKVLGDTAADIYTAPASTTAIVLHCQIASRDDAPREVSLWWTDASAANAATYLLDDAVLPDGAALAAVSGKLVLEAGDKLRGMQDLDDGEVEVSVSVLELT